MGIYLNPGKIEFQRAVNDDIYIDKTGLIAYTNSRLGKASRYLCVSRPRRFGKSMAADMLTAYYSRGCDSKDLFAGREIATTASYREHLNAHDVIRFDVQQFMTSRESPDIVIEQIQRAILRELKKEYTECRDLDNEDKLQAALNMIYMEKGSGFIFIVDEWDCIFRLAPDRPDIQKAYLDFLRNLFKGAVYVDLVYMTGILPIKKYGEHSAVNMFTEFSMTSPKNLSTYYGFTAEEVRQQCRIHNVNFEEIEKWYDGYLVGETHIYNPKSVNDALTWNEFQSYWTGTETYEALKVYIERNYDGLRESIVCMLGGGRCRINTRHFQNDMTSFRSKDDVLTLLVHLGYLTYDIKTEEVLIPNREIEQEFLDAVSGAGWNSLMHSLNQSMSLLESTWKMDSAAVAAGIEEMHSETASVIDYNNELALACVIYMAYYSAGAYYARPLAELPTGKGRADIVYLPLRNTDKPALVIELKWDKSAESAIAQIKNRHYTQWIESYTGDILLVGINYDKSSKNHECLIEKFTK